MSTLCVEEYRRSFIDLDYSSLRRFDSKKIRDRLVDSDATVKDSSEERRHLVDGHE